MKPIDLQYKLDDVFRDKFTYCLDENLIGKISSSVYKCIDEQLWNLLHDKIYHNLATEMTMQVQRDLLCK